MDRKIEGLNFFAEYVAILENTTFWKKQNWRSRFPDWKVKAGIQASFKFSSSYKLEDSSRYRVCRVTVERMSLIKENLEQRHKTRQDGTILNPVQPDGLSPNATNGVELSSNQIAPISSYYNWSI
jgi:hypothetical protein